MHKSFTKIQRHVNFFKNERGQKKRAALARLLNRNCPIWLLDEPLNGLDSHAQAAFEALIAQHCASGGIAVVASHQPIALPSPQIIQLAEYAA